MALLTPNAVTTTSSSLFDEARIALIILPETGNSCDSKPTNEITKISPVVAFTEKLPSKSEVTADEVPLTTTVAPGNKLPSSSETDPVTVCCAMAT